VRSGPRQRRWRVDRQLGLQTTIGPAGIVYRDNVNGRIVDFRPRGILLRTSCPRGGFPFAVYLSFGGGAGASVAVLCPHGHTTRPAPTHAHG
jgi:hypothetical protein